MKKATLFKTLGFLTFFVLFLSFSLQREQLSEQQTIPNLSQSERNVATAGNLLAYGDTLKDIAKYDSALIAYNNAIALYEPLLESNDSMIWVNYLACKNRSGDCYRRLRIMEDGLNLLMETLDEGKERFGEEHPAVADSYFYSGIIYRNLGEKEKTLEFYEKALAIRLKTLGEVHPDVAYSYNNFGVLYNSSFRELEKALEYYDKSLNTYIQIYGKNHPYVGRAYSNMAGVFTELSQFEKALEFYQKALQIYQKTRPEVHTDISIVYSGIGTTNYNMYLNDRAIENHLKALSIDLEIFGTDHPYIATHYNNLGLSYINYSEYQKAIDYFKKSQSILISFFGQDNVWVAESYVNIGSAYSYLYKNTNSAIHAEEAEKYLQQAISILKKTYGTSHPRFALTLFILGNLHYFTNQYDKAIEYYEEALTVQLELFGEKSIDASESYNSMGEVYSKQGLYTQSLENFHKSLTANAISFDGKDITLNPEPSTPVIQPLQLIEGLHEKARTFYKRYIHAADPADLQYAFDTYSTAVDWIDYQQKNMTRDVEKSVMNTNNIFAFGGMLKTAFDLYERTQRDSFLQHAFTAIEKSRASLLLEGVQNASNLSFAGIPEELRDQEYEIRTLLAHYEKNLYAEEIKGAEADTSKMEKLFDKVFELKNSYDSLLTVFETEYPTYYQLKYDADVLSIAETQKTLPDKQTTLIEYFVSDSLLHAFVINKDEYQLIEIKKDSALEDWIEQLHHSYYSYQLSVDPTQEEYLAYCDTLVTRSQQIYQNVFQPIEKQIKLSEKLIIVPDGILGYLPFEALLRSGSSDNTLHKDHKYLIEDYLISYAYSATLLKEMQDKKGGKAKGNFIAFAPSFDEKELLADASSTRGIDELRGTLTPLKYNIPEVENLQKLIGGKIFTDTAATQLAFMEQAPNYKVIHLATHGKANDLIGDYAYLAFAEIEDSLENELLYNRDLYGIRLNADMVVLSACETGIGELRRGEGIISLARGFSYAGAKSIMTSLWSVNDGATKELMESFYTYLKEGLSKDVALRKAKLDYINNNPHSEAHPFYWAAFIPIGDMQPIYFSNPIKWWLWGGVSLFLLTSLFLYFRAKNPA